MDTWRFYDITHRDHVVCNPSSVERFDEVIGLLDLPPRPRVLDIASGKGEFLLRMAARWGGPDGRDFQAVAVDLSPFVIRDLREAASRRVPAAQIESLVLDGAAYSAEPSRRLSSPAERSSSEIRSGNTSQTPSTSCRKQCVGMISTPTPRTSRPGWPKGSCPGLPW